MNFKTLVVFFALVFFAGTSAFADTESAAWNGIVPAEAVKGTVKQQTVYFYNVGKKLFLAQGGNWGQEAVLSDVGIPYGINYNSEYNNYYFKQTDDGTYLCPVSVENDSKYTLYFLTGHNTSYGFNFTETSDGSGQYRISYDDGAYYMVGTSVDGTTAGADESHCICIMSKDKLSTVTDNSDIWILVSQEEMEDKLVSAAAKSKTLFEDQYAQCSFLVKDHDFARNNVDIASWKGKTSEGETSLVNTQGAMNVPSTTNIPKITYYVGNGYGVNADGQSANGGKWTANIFANGTIQQTVSDIATVGWYQVTANVGTSSTTAKVKLFAQAGDETGATGYAESQTTQAVLASTTSFVDAEELVNEASNKLTVKVFVGKDSDGNVKPLTFGVSATDAPANAWTCMDNFTVTYLGALRNKVVLDEDQTDIAYMNTQNNEVATSGQSTMFLHRTLKAGQWNSIVLPFSISADVIKLVFGEGTKISKLKGADDAEHPNWINFADCTSDGIEAGKLYVINPEKVTCNSTGGDITSSASDEITLTKGTYYALDGNYGQTADYEANVTGDSGAEVYNTAGNVTFMGTYTKQENVIPVNSYYLSGENWKYNTAKTSHAKGFRGWLQTSAQGSETKPYVIAINGVAAMDEPTGIQTMSDGVANADVYDITGKFVRTKASSTDGLKSGVYIAGGRKIVIK